MCLNVEDRSADESETVELKHFRDENMRLKMLAADPRVRQDMFQPVVSKTLVARSMTGRSGALAEEVRASKRRVCDLVEVPRTSYR